MRRRKQVFGHVLRLAVRANPRIAALIAVIVSAQAATVAIVALVQRWMVEGAGLGVTWGLVGAAVLGAAAHAANASGNRIQVNYRIELGERVDLHLAREVYAMAARIPTIDHFERPDFLDRLHLLRKGGRSLAASCWSAAEMVAAFVSLGLSLWLLATIHPALILMALLGLPPLVFARRSQRVVRAAMDAGAEATRRERELHELCVQPGSAKELRIAGSGPIVDGIAHRLWAQTSNLEDQARIRGALWQLAGWVCFGAGFAVAMTLVTRLAMSGAATLGDVVLVIALATRLRTQIELAVFSVNEVAEAGSVAEHFVWLIDYEQRHSLGGDEPVPRRLIEGIRLRSVGFSYPGTDDEVLTDVDLTLPAGATVALVGVNGSGKTTLIKLLTGMYEPTTGTIEVDGQSLSAVNRAAWFAANSCVFQDFSKFEMRVMETVGVGDLSRMEDRDVIAAAVDRAGADAVVGSLPAGLEAQLGRTFDGAELSHGQWQKLALARGMMRDGPLLMVLDEPTAALDPQAEYDLFERFATMAAAVDVGAITVLVSHRFSTVHMADHIVVIKDGQVRESGTHEELLRRDGDYAALYRIQAKAYA